MKTIWNKAFLILGTVLLLAGISGEASAAVGRAEDSQGFTLSMKGDIVSYDHQKYNYAELKEDVAALVKRYKKNCRAEVIGTTPDNRDMIAVTIGNKKAKKHLVVLGNIHAREYMTTVLCMRQIEITLDNLSEKIGGKRISQILNQVAIHYIPSCDPDGTAISQYGHSGIRDSKLRANLKKMNMNSYTTLWKANGRGVDLNRNWNYGFYVRGKRGWQGFSGTKAFSEPETRAIRDYIKGMAARYGIRVFLVNPKGTSMFAFDGSGKVTRHPDNYSICRFSSGKTYNCDLSASYNIGARYFLRAYKKAMPATAWSEAEAKDPSLSKRTTWTLSSLRTLAA